MLIYKSIYLYKTLYISRLFSNKKSIFYKQGMDIILQVGWERPLSSHPVTMGETAFLASCHVCRMYLLSSSINFKLSNEGVVSIVVFNHPLICLLSRYSISIFIHMHFIPKRALLFH